METSKPYEDDVPTEVPDWAPHCTPNQVKDFIEGVIWREMVAHMRFNIFTLRNLLESGEKSQREYDFIRGQIRDVRDMMVFPQVLFQQLVSREQETKEQKERENG